MTEHQKELAVERLVRRVQQLDEAILETIGKRIAQIGSLNQAEVYQVQQMLKYGADLRKIEEYIARVTDLNIKDIEKLFEQEAKDNYEFAKQFYKARDLPYVPYEQNQALQEQVRVIAKATIDEYVNISRTLGFAIRDNMGNLQYTELSKGYQDIIDKAILSISQGKSSYNEQMRQVVSDLGSNGIRVVDFASGYHRRTDSQVRMNILDGMRNLSNENQKLFGEEYGADGVEITVHINPAIDHEEVQGKQFSLAEFQKLQDTGIATDYKGRTYDMHNKYGSFRPISTMNCYHDIRSIVLGVSKPQYTDNELKQIRENNNKGFEFEGKHYTNYQGTQLQRQIETEIRKSKEKKIIAKASGLQDEANKAQARIDMLEHKYTKLSKASKLESQEDKRMQINKRQVHKTN